MQPIVLDIRTLSFITMGIALFFAIGLFVFGLSQKKFKGFPLLALASASFAVGLFLLGYRDILPDFITIVIANTLLIVGLVLYFEGSRRFLSVSEKINPLSIAAIIINIGTFIYFTYQLPSDNYRIISFSVIATIVSFLCAREFFCNNPIYWRKPGLMLKMVFIVYGTYQALRIFWTLGESTIESFMSAGNFHSFAFIFIMFLVTGTTFGFIWMASKRFEFELNELAKHDVLTRILNRRGVEVFADREFSKMRRTGINLTVIMADIDHLKDINDQFGHNAGDQVLKAFTQLTKQILRPYDIFGRIGGDEFIIILPNTDLGQSLMVTERIRIHLENFVMEVGGNKIHLTASYGLAGSDPGVNSFEELTASADKALYYSKSQGCNKVTHFSQMSKE